MLEKNGKTYAVVRGDTDAVEQTLRDAVDPEGLEGSVRVRRSSEGEESGKGSEGGLHFGDLTQGCFDASSFTRLAPLYTTQRQSGRP